MNNGKTYPGSERCTAIKQSRGEEGKSLTGWDVSLTLGKPSRNPWGAMIPRLRDVIVHMLCWLKCIGSSSVYLPCLSSSSMWVSRLSDPNGVHPTEVEAKSQKFNGDSWLCLDTIRLPVLFSTHILAFSFGETPNPKSGLSERVFWMYCNSCILFYFSLSLSLFIFFFWRGFLVCWFFSLKRYFSFRKNESEESINSWGGTWNVV